MKYLPHLLILSVSLLLAFFALGAFSIETVLRGLLAACFFFVAFAVISHANMIRKTPAVCVEPRIFVACALGPIEKGDFVLVDLETYTATKVDEGGIQ